MGKRLDRAQPEPLGVAGIGDVGSEKRDLTATRQWGRVLMNAETRRENLGIQPDVHASMGPRSHERGNVRARGAVADPVAVPSIYSSARTELAKLLIYGLFRKNRVLAQDGMSRLRSKSIGRIADSGPSVRVGAKEHQSWINAATTVTHQ